MVVECESCNAFVEAKKIGSYERLTDGSGPSTQFVLLRCEKCQQPILVAQTNVGNEAEGDIWGQPEKLFPISKYRTNPNAPRNIQ